MGSLVKRFYEAIRKEISYDSGMDLFSDNLIFPMIGRDTFALFHAFKERKSRAMQTEIFLESKYFTPKKDAHLEHISGPSCQFSRQESPVVFDSFFQETVGFIDTCMLSWTSAETRGNLENLYGVQSPALLLHLLCQEIESKMKVNALTEYQILDKMNSDVSVKKPCDPMWIQFLVELVKKDQVSARDCLLISKNYFENQFLSGSLRYDYLKN